jgi:myo-inositol-1(or 4)-monophosphatase
MADELDARFEAALRLAGEAGALAMRLRPAPGDASVRRKGAQDWVTEADAAVERFLAERLGALFPEDGFQGEEFGIGRAGGGRDGALRWVVDPIDGTANYARGGTRWCVSVGLLRGQQAVLGVLVAPALGETYSACRGRGATLNGQPIRAAATAATGDAIVECGWSPRRPNSEYLALCGRVMGTGAAIRAGGSGALGLAEVAAGRIDGYVELHINLWDVAAALAVLHEAGARTNDFLGGDGIAAGNPIRAAAPDVSDALERAAGW